MNFGLLSPAMTFVAHFLFTKILVVAHTHLNLRAPRQRGPFFLSGLD